MYLRNYLKFCATLTLTLSLYSHAVTINMRDADIRAFISDISSLTGKTFIVDPRINAKITIISREDLSIDEENSQDKDEQDNDTIRPRS